MKLLTNVFDLWVFTRRGKEPTYLLLRTSEEKANRFFGGGRFWQIPGDFLQEENELPAVLRRPVAELGLTLRGLVEGLEWTRRYVSEREEPDVMLRLL